MKHNVHGSLLTNAHLCEQTPSATTRHEYAAKRNTNSTAAVTSDFVTFCNILRGFLCKRQMQNTLYNGTAFIPFTIPKFLAEIRIA